MFHIFRKKYVWAVVLSLLLVLFSAYTLLDAFVFPHTYAIVPDKDIHDNNDIRDNSDSGIAPAEPASDKKDVTVTEDTYEDENIRIQIETVKENGAVYYVADVELASADSLKTAFAQNTFGKNITAKTSEMAAEHSAIFAVNGDYCGFRDTGVIIRNGTLYRDRARSGQDRQALMINSDGSLQIIEEGSVSGDALIQNGVWQCFSFGPALVENGKSTSEFHTNISKSANPRTAIGQISPLHYLFVVADGRSGESRGMTLSQLAQVFTDRGAEIAYNLDGGGSSAMWFNGKIINNPTDGRRAGERNISDIIYIQGGGLQ